MDNREVAILYSGGTDSLALFALAATGRHQDLPKASRIHLLHMLNGMGRFPDFPRERFLTARRILAAQIPHQEDFPPSDMQELDMGRLFQGLWLDRFEELMPRYNGKNLVCAACKVGMHARGVIYCIEHFVPLLLVGYTKKQNHYPEQTPVFMEKISAFSAHFGIQTRFPVYDDFTGKDYTRHVLEDFGLPSTGGGERKCLFCQTLTTASEKEIGAYLDDMLSLVSTYVEHKIHGRVREAAECFPPGRKSES